MRTSFIAALALATAACSGGGRNQLAAETNAAETNNAAEPVRNQVAALSEGQRNAVFIRAIRDAGLECQHVERSVPAGAGYNLPAWRATCQGGGDYVIGIGADGTAQILAENRAAGVNQPETNAATPAGNRQE